jgi:hypothetical protein
MYISGAYGGWGVKTQNTTVGGAATAADQGRVYFYINEEMWSRSRLRLGSTRKEESEGSGGGGSRRRNAVRISSRNFGGVMLR